MDNRYYDDGRGSGEGFVPDQAGVGVYSNPYTSTGSIVEMTNTEDLLFRLESNLRGEFVNSSGVPVKVGGSLMNSEGIKDVMMIMRSFSDRASVMTHFTNKDIMMLMEFLNDVIIKALMVNRVNYGFNNPSGRDLVLSACNFCGFSIIKRGLEGGERRFWKGSVIDYNVRSSTDAKKGGVFSGLFGKKP